MPLTSRTIDGSGGSYCLSASTDGSPGSTKIANASQARPISAATSASTFTHQRRHQRRTKPGASPGSRLIVNRVSELPAAMPRRP